MKTFVIFDLDGTLLNTIDDLATATNHALTTLGYPPHGMWVYPTLVGNGVAKLIERALPAEAREEKNIRGARSVPRVLRRALLRQDGSLSGHTRAS